MAQQIETVGVLGAGLMGHGIAQVAAQSGYQVVLREVDEAALANGVGKIEKQLARGVEKEKLSGGFQFQVPGFSFQVSGRSVRNTRPGGCRKAET